MKQRYSRLLAEMGSSDRARREAALYQIQHEGAAAVELLIRALRSPSPLVQKEAAFLAGLLFEDGAPAADDLLRLLSADHEGVRREAAESLGDVGVATGRTLSALVRAAACDHSIPVRVAAARSLATLGDANGDRTDASALLRALERSSYPELTAALCGAVGSLIRDGEDVIRLLESRLASPDSSVRAAAAEALGRVGLCSAFGRRELARLMTADAADVSVAAALAWWRLGGDVSEVVAALVRRLQDGTAVHAAAVALLELGSEAVSATAALLAVLGNLHGRDRVVIAECLACFGELSELQARNLVQHISDDSLAARETSLWVAVALMNAEFAVNESANLFHRQLQSRAAHERALVVPPLMQLRRERAWAREFLSEAVRREPVSELREQMTQALL